MLRGLAAPPPRRAAYARLLRLSGLLRDAGLREEEAPTAADPDAVARMSEFTELADAFISKPSRPVLLDRLTAVGDILGVTAQQRKDVRLALCSQLAQPQVFRGALVETLKSVRASLRAATGQLEDAHQMIDQIAAAVIRFVGDATELPPDSPAPWMKPNPPRKVVRAVPARKWGEALEMLVDLTECMHREPALAQQMARVEAMKEAMFQITDIVIERGIGFKDARRQESLMQTKLTKCLGHSSRGLFMLLMYYLYGTVAGVEVRVWRSRNFQSKRSRKKDGNKERRITLRVAKLLVDGGDAYAVRAAVKGISRALGVFRVVHESAGIAAALELQPELWCLLGGGSGEKALTYRGDTYRLHRLAL